MCFDLAALILFHFSTTEKVIAAYNSAKADNQNLSGSDLDAIADKTEIEVFDRYYGSEEMTPIYECTDLETLESTFRNLRVADEQLTLVLKDSAKSNQEKNEEIERASRTMCAELSRIRTLNQGELPHKELLRLWELFRCDAKAQQC